MTKLFFPSLLSTLVLLFSFSALAQDDMFLEGGHYELLEEVQPVQTGENIEVAELFWYRCPHCYRLQPYLKTWLRQKPDNAELVSIPAILNDNWAFHARAFYTFEALDLTEELHDRFFDAIHRERIPFSTPADVADWVSEQGIDSSAIVATFNSFAVDNKVNFSHIMTRNYQITGVPSIIVDGRYRTSVSLAGGHDALLQVINYLVEKAASQRQS